MKKSVARDSIDTNYILERQKYITDEEYKKYNERKWVWIPTPTEVYTLGFITREDEEMIEVDCNGTLYKVRSCDAYKPNPPKFDMVEDLAALSHLNEPSVLYNIKKRYQNNFIYTYSGLFLLAVNPYRELKIYGEKHIKSYAMNRKNELEPHIFAIANEAYNSMLTNKENQSILITGESGAGKTENTKRVIEFLAHVANERINCDKTVRNNDLGDRRLTSTDAENNSLDAMEFRSIARTIDQQIIESNPILEAFGNAQTMKNNNSSRFGKFIEIIFNGGVIAGAHIEKYLLEKSRVTNPNKGERNYHIFYQLLFGANDGLISDLMLTRNPGDYRYLRESNFKVNTIDDVVDFNNLLQSMDALNISEQEQMAYFRIIAAILHLGNLEFGDKATHRSGATSDVHSGIHKSESDMYATKQSSGTVTFENQTRRSMNSHKNNTDTLKGDYNHSTTELLNVDVAEKICKLLSISLNDFVRCLLHPVIKAGQEIVEHNRTKEQVIRIVDALSKILYDNLFDSIIDKLNSTLSPAIKGSFIGVLDIAGFEIFKNNSFEQLCINYTNEKLQQFFNHHMFILEQEIYKQERIDWNFIDFGLDLQPTIDIIEKSNPIGILSYLDEECVMPKATDLTLLSKLESNIKSKKFQKSKIEDSFVLDHYAGRVEYSVQNWLTKNKDPHSEEISRLIHDSESPYVSQIIDQGKPANHHPGEDYIRRGMEQEFSTIRGVHNASIRSSSPVSTSFVKKGIFRTVGQKHKEQLFALMDQLRSTNPHFVRCILPNYEKASCVFDNALVLDQLKCNGVLEGIRISRQGFPSRMKYSEFVDRYKVLLYNSTGDNADSSQVASNTIGDGVNPLGMGNGIGSRQEPTTLSDRNGTSTNSYNTLDNGRNTLSNNNGINPSASNSSNVSLKRAGAALQNTNHERNHGEYSKMHVLPIDLAEKIIKIIELNSSQFRLGQTKIFFKQGVLADIEDLRDKKISEIMRNVQALIRRKLTLRKYNLEQKRRNATVILQRNAKICVDLQKWKWWKLYLKVKPLLEVSKKENEMKEKDAQIQEREELLQEKEKQIQEIQSRIAALEQQIREAHKENLALEKSVMNEKRFNKEKDELLMGLRNNLEAELKSKNEMIESYKTEAEHLKGEYHRSMTSNEALIKKLEDEKLQEQKASIGRIKGLEQDNTTIKQDVEALKQENSDLQTSIKDLTQKLKSKEAEIQIVSKKMEFETDEVGRYQRELEIIREEGKEVISRFKEENQILNSKIQELEDKVVKTDKELESQKEKADMLDSELKAHEETESILEVKVKKLTGDVDNYRTKCIETDRKLAENVSAFEKQKTAIIELENKIKHHQATDSQNKKTITELENKLKQGFKGLNSEKQELAERITGKEEENRELLSEVQALKLNLELMHEEKIQLTEEHEAAIRELSKQSKEDKKVISQLEEALDVMQSKEAEVRKNLVEKENLLASKGNEVINQAAKIAKLEELSKTQLGQIKGKEKIIQEYQLTVSEKEKVVNETSYQIKEKERELLELQIVTQSKNQEIEELTQQLENKENEINALNEEKYRYERGIVNYKKSADAHYEKLLEMNQNINHLNILADKVTEEALRVQNWKDELESQGMKLLQKLARSVGRNNVALADSRVHNDLISKEVADLTAQSPNGTDLKLSQASAECTDNNGINDGHDNGGINDGHDNGGINDGHDNGGINDGHNNHSNTNGHNNHSTTNGHNNSGISNIVTIPIQKQLKLIGKEFKNFKTSTDLKNKKLTEELEDISFENEKLSKELKKVKSNSDNYEKKLEATNNLIELEKSKSHKLEVQLNNLRMEYNEIEEQYNQEKNNNLNTLTDKVKALEKNIKHLNSKIKDYEVLNNQLVLEKEDLNKQNFNLQQSKIDEIFEREATFNTGKKKLQLEIQRLEAENQKLHRELAEVKTSSETSEDSNSITEKFYGLLEQEKKNRKEAELRIMELENSKLQLSHEIQELENLLDNEKTLKEELIQELEKESQANKKKYNLSKEIDNILLDVNKVIEGFNKEYYNILKGYRSELESVRNQLDISNKLNIEHEAQKELFTERIDQLGEEIRQFSHSNDSLRKTVSNLQNELNSLQVKYNTLGITLEEKDGLLETYTERIEELQVLHSELKEDLIKKGQDYDKIRAERKRQIEELEGILRSRNVTNRCIHCIDLGETGTSVENENSVLFNSVSIKGDNQEKKHSIGMSKNIQEDNIFNHGVMSTEPSRIERLATDSNSTEVKTNDNVTYTDQSLSNESVPEDGIVHSMGKEKYQSLERPHRIPQMQNIAAVETSSRMDETTNTSVESKQPTNLLKQSFERNFKTLLELEKNKMEELFKIKLAEKDLKFNEIVIEKINQVKLTLKEEHKKNLQLEKNRSELEMKNKEIELRNLFLSEKAELEQQIRSKTEIERDLRVLLEEEKKRFAKLEVKCDKLSRNVVTLQETYKELMEEKLEILNSSQNAVNEVRILKDLIVLRNNEIKLAEQELNILSDERFKKIPEGKEKEAPIVLVTDKDKLQSIERRRLITETELNRINAEYQSLEKQYLKIKEENESTKSQIKELKKNVFDATKSNSSLSLRIKQMERELQDEKEMVAFLKPFSVIKRK